MANEVNLINQSRIGMGLDRLTADDHEFKQAEQFQGFKDEAGGLIDQSLAQADVRADNTFNQIKQAGLAGVADQFRRSQRSIAFDTARRGTLGGSRSIERGAQAQQGANQDINSVLSQATQAADQQRLSDLGPAFALQQQIAGGDPFANLLHQNQLNSIQQQGQVATGQFDLSDQRENVRAGSDMNRASAISNAFGNVGLGIGSFLDDQSMNNQLLGLSSIQLNNQQGGSANPNSTNFIGPRR